MNRSRRPVYLTGANEPYAPPARDPSQSDWSARSDRLQSNQSDQSNQSNQYAEAFPARGGMQGNVLLGEPDYKNQNNTLHGNIGASNMHEQTFDNKILIDSAFKDYATHPDVFKFIVRFNGTRPKIHTISAEVDDTIYTYPKYLEGDTQITLDRVFRNIKYVNVNALIMPNYIEFVLKPDGSYGVGSKKLANHMYKYLILRIDELSNGRCYSNNPAISKEAFIMKKDDDICTNNQIWVPIYRNVSYFDSMLKVVDRLTVEICDDRGQRLRTTLDGVPHDFFAEYRKIIDTALYLQSLGTDKANNKIKELVPRLESLKRITEYLSPELHLTFNTLEPQIDTLPQFRY